MRLLVDIEALVRDGTVSAAQAARIRARARADSLSLGIGILLVFGAVAVVAGTIFLLESARATVALGLGLGAAGLLLALSGRGAHPALPGMLAVIGILTHLGGIFGLEAEPAHPWLVFLYAAALIGGAGLALDLRFMTALSVFALAQTLATTGYFQATYWLAIFEPTLTIAIFGTLALAAAGAAPRLEERWARHARIFGLIAFIWVNLAFWIGSLWGDRIGETLIDPGLADGLDWEARAAAEAAFRESLTHIPELAFVVAWAALILAAGALGAWRARRSVVNAAATFGAIHFYTQLFERVEMEPRLLILAGLLAIAFGWVLIVYNRRRPG